MNKSKKIYLSIFALIVAFIGLFGLYHNTSIGKVNADELDIDYVYRGSNILVSTYLYNTADYSDVFKPVNVYINFRMSRSTNSDGYIDEYFAASVSRASDSDDVVFSYNPDAFGIALSTSNFGSWNNYYIPTWYGSTLQNQIRKYAVFGLFIDYDYSFNPIYLTISTTVGFAGNLNLCSTKFEYVDSANKILTVVIPTLKPTYVDPDNPVYGYTYRQYFVSNATVTDNEYYQLGLANGENKGYANGYNSGKQDGYNSGREAGYNFGFSEGVASANDYSFLGLMGAVVDAPLNMFIQTFDFNILGFNMKDFFLSLLTIALIFTIIRLCMGGKS